MKRGFTLVEVIVVVGIFVFLFGGILTVMTVSDRSWRTGQNKLIEQQEARKSMDSIGRFLRQSNPDWGVLIYNGNTSIMFYRPIFDTDGAITAINWVIFKPDPADTTKLIMKEEGGSWNAVAQDIKSITFGGGCPGCATVSCASVASDCPIVSVEIKTKKEKEFTLISQIALRNQTVTLPGGVEIEAPPEGEF
jgi:prepilin-type N-terminal cleavage/methylation domain-containing protein